MKLIPRFKACFSLTKLDAAILNLVSFESGDHPASKRTYDNLELGPSCPEEEFPVLDIPGPFMLLQYWVDILVTDFQVMHWVTIKESVMK